MLYNRFNRHKNESIWEYHTDSQYSDVAPFVVNNDRSHFLVDGLGSTTDVSQVPTGTPNAWKDSTVHPRASKEAYILRLDFTAKLAQTNGYAYMELDIGDDSSIVIWTNVITFPKGAGVYHKFSKTIPIFCGDTFLANGGKVYINTESGSDAFSSYDHGIVLLRAHLPSR